jgi:Immunity protein 58
MRTHLVVSALCVLLVASLIGCIACAYLLVDRSITLAHVTQSVESSAKSIRNLESLLETEWRGMPKDKILQKLEEKAAENVRDKIIVKKEGEGIIWFDDTQFRFESGRLRKIGPP